VSEMTPTTTSGRTILYTFKLKKLHIIIHYLHKLVETHIPLLKYWRIKII